MPDLVTVDEIRSRLKLQVNADQDAVLDAFRQAVEERVLAVCGFLNTDDPYFHPIQRTDQLVDVQLGVSRLTEFRPIVPMGARVTQQVRLAARSMASDTFSDIIGEVRSLRDGRVMPLASELTPVFPPIGGQAPWLRWRQMIWPVVRVTYLVDPIGSPTNPVPRSLRAAVVEWAAAFYAVNPLTGRLKSFSAEKISEQYENYLLRPMPQVVAMLLAPYVRGQAGIVF